MWVSFLNLTNVNMFLIINIYLIVYGLVVTFLFLNALNCCVIFFSSNFALFLVPQTSSELLYLMFHLK